MATLVRTPLQPLNLNSVPSLETHPKKPKRLSLITTPTQRLILENASRESAPIASSVCKESLNPEKRDDELREASLAEELEIVRKRRERLRMEREKTEELLKERDLVLENAMKEMEKRAEEQNSPELEIYKIILLNDLRSSSMRVSPVQSLRIKEEEKKNRALSEESVSDEIIGEPSNTQDKGKGVALQN